MNFLKQKNELLRNQFLRGLILFLVVGIILFLVSDVVLHHYQMGLTLEKLNETLRGSEENFTDPILFDVLLEKVHLDTLSSLVILLLLSVILIRLEPNRRELLVHLVFITAIASLISLLLAFYFPLFSIVWIVLFLFWHFLALFISFKIIWRISW